MTFKGTAGSKFEYYSLALNHVRTSSVIILGHVVNTSCLANSLNKTSIASK
jgi:hypothetical protein